MEKYMIVNKLGEGSFGVVYRAVDLVSGEIVAIKQVKRIYGSWQECLNLREVKSLLMMKHPNVVHLREVVRECGILFLVFEFMESNLFQAMRQRQGRRFSEEEIKNLCFQVFQGLTYMHRRGYFHRDLKPENLLVSGDKIKIADLGMAREIFSALPYTDKVTTRWYRAPEVLLRSKNYNFKVDMWAMGVIMAEMFTFCTIFPGKSGIDQIDRICSLIGAPTMDSWPEGVCLARAQNFEFHGFGGKNMLPSLLLRSSASKEAIDLIQQLCSWDPAKRPMAADVLQHPFFSSCYKFDNIYQSPASLIERCRKHNLTALSEELSFQFSCPKFVNAAAAAAVFGGCQKNANTVRITQKNMDIQGRGCDCAASVWLAASRAWGYTVYERDKPVTDVWDSSMFSSKPMQSFLMGKIENPEAEPIVSKSDVFFSKIEQRVTENLLSLLSD